MTHTTLRRSRKQPIERAVWQHRPIKVLAIGVGVILVMLAAISLIFGTFASDSAASTANKVNTAGATQPLAGTLAPINNDVQQVTISMQGRTYLPNPVRVRVGVPVRFTVDLTTVTGCYRTIVIPELGVSGRVSSSNTVMEFTPTKSGTFRMTCGMGMADGTIIVEDDNGQAPPAIAQTAPTRGSCGGGCGCGG
jgi:hypothetical protein